MDKGIRVLVVDDEKDFLFTMVYWLKSKGYSVLTANSGAEALEIIKKEQIDIIFLDMYMPMMSGPETLKNLRQLNKDVPVIIITAYANDEKVAEAEQHGVSGLFCKQRELSESEALIETVLRRHKGLSQEKGELE